MSAHTVENIILLAKKRHWEELQKLSVCTEFVETIGWIIHQIQIERGLSCLYLASYGQRMAEARIQIVEENRALEQRFRQGLHDHLDQQCNTDAKQLTLISWILLGFDELKALRYKVTLMKISFSDCIQSYTRFISSLVSLIFEITDRTVNSKLSVYLMALYNLVQAKEFAGQERAVGSFLFGSGHAQQAHQQKLSELIALQDRHFELFCQFGNEALRDTWGGLVKSDLSLQHQALRTKLLSAEDQQILQSRQGEQWFDLCSQRLTDIWNIQCNLIKEMHQNLQQLITKAYSDLELAQKYVADLQGKSVQSSSKNSYFYNLEIPVENAFSFLAQAQPSVYPVESIMFLLQQQSQQIAEIESELSETKKALAERKLIERAKGLLMHKMGISEVDAYKVMRSTAMDQSRKLIDVAENILAQS